MPCFSPLQASFSIREDGKKDVRFSNVASRLFLKGIKPLGDSNLTIPCGRCMGCRLERSRQWALRCVHESKMYEDNCFVTLTFDNEHMLKQCPNGSLDRKHTQDFMKRLRRKFSDRVIRVFGCGEYGDALGRPHYHFCLFNFDFKDKVKWKIVNGFWYYNSKVLSSLWTFGHAVVTGFSFDTAAYVARYCTKKIVGSTSDEHYRGRLPEFSVFSTHPGLGKPWFDEFGKSDVVPHDNCVVNGAFCKVPRYYDKLRERDDPDAFARVKQQRVERAVTKAYDNTYDRLSTREKCMNARIRLLVRNLEK